ncbi:MAG: hypothetical protein AMXMBFR4_23280 [Candidatus Hydrogenedentota bacterium]
MSYKQNVATDAAGLHRMEFGGPGNHSGATKDYTEISVSTRFTTFGDFGGKQNAVVRHMMKYMEARRTNQRRHTRHNVSIAAWLEFENDSVYRGTVSTDLGIEGARFSSLTPVEVGQRVLVRMQLGHTSNVIECKGRVCWSQPMPNRLYDFGVRFVDLDEEECSRLQSFLERWQMRTAYAVV